MNTEQLNQRIERLIEKAKSQHRRVRFIWRENTISNLIILTLILMYYAPAVVAIFFIAISYNEMTQGILHGVLAVSFVIPCIFALGSLGRDTFNGGTPHRWLTLKILTACGISSALNKEQTYDIVYLSNVDPRFRDMCIEWGARNVGGNLTGQELKILKTTNYSIDRLKYQYQQWLTNNIEKEEIEMTLRESGIKSEIESRSAHIHLQKSTQIVNATEPARRI